MVQLNVTVRPSPFVLKMTAGAPAKIPSVTRLLYAPPVQSPKVQVGQQVPASR
jgi:hypothetical protein